MTQETYSEIYVGMSAKRLLKENGQPYSIRDKNGMEEYTYIERVTNGNRLVYENHFVLYVQDGVVVGKSTTQERRPSFDVIYQEDPNYPQYP